MKSQPHSPNGNTKIMHTNEVVLIAFAALLLAAAVQSGTNSHHQDSVNVNLPLPTTADEILHTDSIKAPAQELNTQTTALLSDSHSALPVALPTDSEAPKLVN